MLIISTLWPNAAQPRFGTFVESSIRALQQETEWEPVVVNPIGLPPIAFGKYRALAGAATSGSEEGIAVHRPTFRLIPSVGARLNPGAIVSAVLSLARRLHAEKPFDLVDAQFFWPDGPAVAEIGRALDLPVSIKARGGDIHLWGAKPYSRRMMIAAAQQAGGLLAVCGALADDMAVIGMPRDKITVHYTGLDRDRFRPLGHTSLRACLSAELGFPLARDEHLLATVGALIPRKGQELVIRALATLPRARLLLIGQGPDEGRLRQLAADEGVADRVHFLGSVDHDVLPPILSAADVMVLPSASEGLANAWIEALACGTPLVITDAGGAREVVTGPSAGVIVTRDADAIARGIRLVLEKSRDALTVAARANRFDWVANGRALGRHYDRIVSGRT
ncbi:glycosyltransferase [Qipengyuania spongiae]|uniref:Glycosyltransferase n=1 Tax=Qipengyuania spongiae TaxID=2909673 RepID=A0ABY5SZU9_9SPHN|nr:glycosyltransferase [Qipengyuania spongiae]UVI38526.1 glycosyltransferase [Qipengyuania spongiae]